MRLATVTLGILLIAATAGAQGDTADRAQRSRGANFDQLKTFLELTDQQINDIRNVRQSQGEALRSDLQELAGLARQVRAEIEKDPIDSAKVSQLRAEIKSKETAIQAKREEVRNQVRGVLNADQKARLSKLEEALSLQAAARQAVAMGLLDGPGNPAGTRQRIRRRLQARMMLEGAARPLMAPAPGTGMRPER